MNKHLIKLYTVVCHCWFNLGYCKLFLIVNGNYDIKRALTGSVAYRYTSSSMITLSNSMFEYWDYLPRGPSDTANRDQHLSVLIFQL